MLVPLTFVATVMEAQEGVPALDNELSEVVVPHGHEKREGQLRSNEAVPFLREDTEGTLQEREGCSYGLYFLLVNAQTNEN